MPEATGSEHNRHVEDTIDRLAADIFTWASGPVQAPVLQFEPRLKRAIETALELYNPGTQYLVRVYDTRLGYDSGGCYTNVQVHRGTELVGHRRVLLDHNARKLHELAQRVPVNKTNREEE